MSGRDPRVLTRRIVVTGLCALSWPYRAFAAVPPFDDRFVTFDPPVPMSSASLLDRKGRPFHFGPRPGRAAIVTFWASWCPACRTDLPKLAAVRHAFASRAIDVVAVNVDDTPLDGAAAHAAGIATGSIPLSFDRAGRTLAAASTYGRRSAFQPFGMPITFFCDRTALVRGYVKGSVEWKEETAALIAEWL